MTDLTDVLLSIVLAIFMVVTCICGYKIGYENGQIDALKGKQHCKLIEFEDGERGYFNDPKPSDFDEDHKNFKIIKP